jgi:hypothetical protein
MSKTPDPSLGVHRVVIWPRLSSAGLRHDNHCGVWPLCFEGKSEDGKEYSVIDGWEPKGWAYAPWKSGTGETLAIVFEKTSPARETYEEQDLFDPGLYWCHGDISKMRIRPR